MSEEDAQAEPVVSGTVKWFDNAKGFGFIISDEGGPDILLHANVLRNFGQGSVADQARIRVVVQRTERGIQAQRVLSIDPPDQEQSEDGAGIDIEATVRVTGQTGVEMEALTAVSVAALTVYDMCKAVERGMQIEAVRLVAKSGGKSGDYAAP